MLVSAKSILQHAEADKYAVVQFNINNLEWNLAILEAARGLEAPVILGITEAAAKNMGGLRVTSAMVHSLLENYPEDLPVALHLDHASWTCCLEAIGAGFTSVMFDGSKLPFAENLAKTKCLPKFVLPTIYPWKLKPGRPLAKRMEFPEMVTKPKLQTARNLPWQA